MTTTQRSKVFWGCFTWWTSNAEFESGAFYPSTQILAILGKCALNLGSFSSLHGFVPGFLRQNAGQGDATWEPQVQTDRRIA